MTSDARELSDDAGQPILLADFARGLVHRYYTSADRPIVHGGQTYLPTAISISELDQTSEMRKLTRTVTVPSNLDIADWWRPYPPTEPIALTVYAKHYGETDALVEWVGRVVSSSFEGAKLNLASEPSVTSAKRIGLKRCWQKGCPLALYSCGVTKASRAVPAIVAGVAGLSVTASAFASLPDGRFAGGFVEWLRADGLVETRSIETHVGDTIGLSFGAADLVTGLGLTAFPGCAGTLDDCAYYDNVPNYGGDPYIPDRSPNDGNPVF